MNVDERTGETFPVILSAAKDLHAELNRVS
jgi:hypothetical protein